MSASAPKNSARSHESRLAGVRMLAALVSLAAVTACSGPSGRPVDDLLFENGRYLSPDTKQPYSGVAFATFQDEPTVVAQRLSLMNGHYHGPFEEFFHNRRLSSKEFYENGVRSGPYEWYFENGKLFEQGTYEHGRREGPYRAYWDTGDLYEEGTYVDGAFDGPRSWYKDGRLIEMVSYRHGVMDGLYERYQIDGSLDLKGMLQDGEPCGIWFEAERTITYPLCGISIAE